jgi:hypothetical protein
MAFQRPSNVLPTGVQTGVPTPFQRYSNGIPRAAPAPPYPPGAGRAPQGPLGGPSALPSDPTDTG